MLGEIAGGVKFVVCCDLHAQSICSRVCKDVFKVEISNHNPAFVISLGGEICAGVYGLPNGEVQGDCQVHRFIKTIRKFNIKFVIQKTYG